MPVNRDLPPVPPGKGQSFWLAGDLVTLKAVGADTGGAYAVAEIVTPPQGGPPPHVHSREEEAFYILEGEVSFQVAEGTLLARAGAFVYGPRGIPHAYKNVGSQPAKMLVIASPAGFEAFVEEAGHLVTDRSAPPPPVTPDDVAQLVAVAAKYGIEIKG